ncbi:hypothetical protein EVAR_31774_1 [Eumeta japonica]|uniref:Uncharacterized protein n=1 Tax=Eumeta variegata TaxID=151549 RepID=A0A4C1W5R8_EUMVA|nr:hypothetical protein EVAR_31774_1 [Eumeta japonica]
MHPFREVRLYRNDVAPRLGVTAAASAIYDFYSGQEVDKHFLFKKYTCILRECVASYGNLIDVSGTGRPAPERRGGDGTSNQNWTFGFAFDSDSGTDLDSISLQNIHNPPAAPPVRAHNEIEYVALC